MTTPTDGMAFEIKYYAKYLRNGKVEDAVKAHCQISGIHILEEKDKNKDLAVECCERYKAGDHCYRLWKEKPTKHNQNMAFTILTREGQDIPEDLINAVLQAMDKQIIDQEKKEGGRGEVFKTICYIRLKVDLQFRKGTQEEVFREFALEWDIKDSESMEGWEILRERYKKAKKRNSYLKN